LGFEGLKGQLLIAPNILTGLPAFGVTQDNTLLSIEGFKGMVPYTIIPKTTPNCLLWLTKPKLHLNPFGPQGLDVLQLLEKLNFTKPFLA
jgi:hypothetical protein